MTDKPRPYAAVTANVSNELKDQLTRVAKINGNTLSYEITQRLQFTLEWAGHGSVETLSQAMNAMSPSAFAELAIGAEQNRRIAAGTYECAKFETLSRIQAIGARDRRAISNQLTPELQHNAFAMHSPPGATALADSVKESLNSLYYETDFELSDDEKNAFSVEFEMDLAASLSQISGVCERWVKAMPENDSTNGHPGKRIARHCRAGELLFKAGCMLIDFRTHIAHEVESLKASEELRKAGLKNGDPLGDELKPLVAQKVDEIDAATLELIKAQLPLHQQLGKVGSLYLETRKSLRKIVI